MSWNEGSIGSRVQRDCRTATGLPVGGDDAADAASFHDDGRLPAAAHEQLPHLHQVALPCLQLAGSQVNAIDVIHPATTSAWPCLCLICARAVVQEADETMQSAWVQRYQRQWHVSTQSIGTLAEQSWPDCLSGWLDAAAALSSDDQVSHAGQGEGGTDSVRLFVCQGRVLAVIHHMLCRNVIRHWCMLSVSGIMYG